jgi:hypothetical protein
MKTTESLNDTLNELLKFPLMEAIAGRCSRRFCLGAEISDGVLASYCSTIITSNLDPI